MTALQQDLELVTQSYPALILHDLPSDRQPLWGGMTAQHMVEHLGVVFALSVGKIQVTTGDADEAKLAYRRQRFWESDGTFPRSFTPPTIKSGLNPLRFATMEEAKTKLMQAADEFGAFYVANPDATGIHPHFGALNHEQWVFFHARHMKHHLHQFGFDM